MGGNPTPKTCARCPADVTLDGYHDVPGVGHLCKACHAAWTDERENSKVTRDMRPLRLSDPEVDLDLDLLAKFASGEGGKRTGALKAAGLLEWTVTEKGHEVVKKHLRSEVCRDGHSWQIGRERNVSCAACYQCLNIDSLLMAYRRQEKIEKEFTKDMLFNRAWEAVHCMTAGHGLTQEESAKYLMAFLGEVIGDMVGYKSPIPDMEET